MDLLQVLPEHAAGAEPTTAQAGAHEEALFSRQTSRTIMAVLVLVLVVVLSVAWATPSLARANTVVAWLAALTFPGAFPAARQRPRLLVVGLCGLCGMAMEAADPSTIDTIEYCYLEGQQGVYIETRQGFEVDGVEIKARLDFAAAAIDYRGLQKNTAA